MSTLIHGVTAFKLFWYVNAVDVKSILEAYVGKEGGFVLSVEINLLKAKLLLR